VRKFIEDTHPPLRWSPSGVYIHFGKLQIYCRWDLATQERDFPGITHKTL